MNTKSIEGDRLLVRPLLVLGAAVLLLALVYLLRPVFRVGLVVFAGVLLAVLLDGMATFLTVRTRLPRALALTVSILIFFGFFVGVGWLIGPIVASQIDQLVQRLPAGLELLRDSMTDYEWSRGLIAGAPDPQSMLSAGTGVLTNIGRALSGVAGGIVSLLIVLFVGIYLAADPEMYICGILGLLPRSRRARAKEVFAALGHVLRRWLAGRLASMAVVGLLTVLGLSIIGLPFALALGVIAALLAFVPYIGPVLGAVPAILVALIEDPIKAVYVVIVYVAVQLLETYLITPMIEQRAVSLPPALIITVQILAAVLLGPLGVLLATPLAVVIIVLVQLLYVGDVLGDPVRVLGRR